MEIKLQVIKKNGEKEFVVIPYIEFLKIRQSLEDYEDLIDLRQVKSSAVNEPSIPFYKVAEKISRKAGKERVAKALKK